MECEIDNWEIPARIKIPDAIEVNDVIIECGLRSSAKFFARWIKNVMCQSHYYKGSFFFSKFLHDPEKTKVMFEHFGKDKCVVWKFIGDIDENRNEIPTNDNEGVVATEVRHQSVYRHIYALSAGDCYFVEIDNYIAENIIKNTEMFSCVEWDHGPGRYVFWNSRDKFSTAKLYCLDRRFSPA